MPKREKQLFWIGMHCVAEWNGVVSHSNHFWVYSIVATMLYYKHGQTCGPPKNFYGLRVKSSTIYRAIWYKKTSNCTHFGTQKRRPIILLRPRYKLSLGPWAKKIWPPLFYYITNVWKWEWCKSIFSLLWMRIQKHITFILFYFITYSRHSAMLNS